MNALDRATVLDWYHGLNAADRQRLDTRLLAPGSMLAILLLQSRDQMNRVNRHAATDQPQQLTLHRRQRGDVRRFDEGVADAE